MTALYTVNPSGSLWVGLFHFIFGMLLLFGVILLLAWMLKNLKAKQLLVWALILTVCGLIGTFGMSYFQNRNQMMPRTGVMPMQNSASQNRMGAMMYSPNTAGDPGMNSMMQPGSMAVMMQPGNGGNMMASGRMMNGTSMMKNPQDQSTARMLRQLDQNCTTQPCQQFIQKLNTEVKTELQTVDPNSPALTQQIQN